MMVMKNQGITKTIIIYPEGHINVCARLPDNVHNGCGVILCSHGGRLIWLMQQIVLVKRELKLSFSFITQSMFKPLIMFISFG